MIAISIANSIGSRRSSAPAVVVPVATAATGVGDTSFTANWNAFAGANYYLLDVSLNSSFSSFVGSYQNYVTIGTSQLVSGLTPNTTYYYRLRAATGVDSDAAAFFSRVYTAGGVLSYTEVTATETLVANMKSAGIWTSMKAVYPMVGASAAACAQNLKSSSFTGTFSSGWTFASTGVTGNGSSTYMDTTLIPSVSIASQDSTHLSYYVNQNVKITAFQIGVRGANSTDSFIGARFNATQNYNLVNTNTVNVQSETNNVSGFLAVSRITSAEFKYYKNNTLAQSTLLSSTALSNTYSVWLGTLNLQGAALFPDNAQCAFASIGDGLTDTQASNFYTAVQTFNQTLNRQVGAQIVSDADAQAYINRVYTAGGTLTNTEANAVNQLVIDMKAAGIWTAMKAVYPMVGASAAACAQNLKSSSFTGTFTSGWTFSSTGATPNGTGAYMDTGLNLLSNFSQGNYAFSHYSRTNIAENSRQMGVQGDYSYQLIERYNDDQFYSDFPYPSRIVVTNLDSRGLFLMNRTSNTVHNSWKNGVKQGTNNTDVSLLPLANYSIYIGARNDGGFATYYSTNQVAFSSISNGLTDTQAASLYTCVQTMNTTLSRNV